MENWTFETNGTANCKLCEKSYTNYSIDKRNFRQHMRVQHGKTFIDDSKNNWFDQYFILENYIAKCTLCTSEYKFQSSTLKYHSLRHKSDVDAGKNKQTQECKKQNRWWVKHCTLENNKIQCKYCTASYKIVICTYYYKNHIINSHPTYDIENLGRNWVWQYFETEDNIIGLKCKTCLSFLSVNCNSSGFRNHLINTHKDTIRKQQDDELSQEYVHDSPKIDMHYVNFMRNVIEIYKRSTEENE